MNSLCETVRWLQDWINSNRRCLFKTIEIERRISSRGRFPTYERRIAAAHPFIAPRHRLYSAAKCSLRIAFLGRINSHRHYIPSLRHLKRLGSTSTFLELEVPQKTGLLFAFHCSLSSLPIHSSHIALSALIELISHFRPLRDPYLWPLAYETDHEPVLQRS